MYARMGAAAARIATKIAHHHRTAADEAQAQLAVLRDQVEDLQDQLAEAHGAQEHIADLDAALLATIADRDMWRDRAQLRATDPEQVVHGTDAAVAADAAWPGERHEPLSRAYFEHITRAVIGALTGQELTR